MFTHRLFLQNGLALMTKEDKAALDQAKEIAQQSAKSAAEAAERAQEYSNTVVLVDDVTGVAYRLTVSNGKLMMDTV